MSEQVVDRVDRRTMLRRGGIAAAGAVGVTALSGAISSPALAAGFGFTPIAPYRSLDTRFGPIVSRGEGVDFDVWSDMFGNPRLPSSISAVTFNLTVTQTRSVGWLNVYPASVTVLEEVSHINWTAPNLSIANAGTSKVDTSVETFIPGSMFVYCDGQPGAETHFIVDITGYFS